MKQSCLQGASITDDEAGQTAPLQIPTTINHPWVPQKDDPMVAPYPPTMWLIKADLKEAVAHRV